MRKTIGIRRTKDGKDQVTFGSSSPKKSGEVASSTSPASSESEPNPNLGWAESYSSVVLTDAILEVVGGGKFQIGNNPLEFLRGIKDRHIHSDISKAARRLANQY